MRMSLLIAIPFGFQYTKRGTAGQGVKLQIGGNKSPVAISRMHPFGRSCPLSDDRTNCNPNCQVEFRSCASLIRTSAAFLHRASLEIGLSHSLPTVEIEYEWTCSKLDFKNNKVTQKPFYANSLFFTIVQNINMLSKSFSYLLHLDYQLQGRLILTTKVSILSYCIFLNVFCIWEIKMLQILVIDTLVP